MPILGEVPSESANFFRLNERPHLSKQLADFMLDMLLLPYGYVYWFTITFVWRTIYSLYAKNYIKENGLYLVFAHLEKMMTVGLKTQM
jgi:hypothetical protein